eukprot:1921402-Rhodomonas_salina.1
MPIHQQVGAVCPLGPGGPGPSQRSMIAAIRRPSASDSVAEDDLTPSQRRACWATCPRRRPGGGGGLLLLDASDTGCGASVVWRI